MSLWVQKRSATRLLLFVLMLLLAIVLEFVFFQRSLLLNSQVAAAQAGDLDIQASRLHFAAPGAVAAPKTPVRSQPLPCIGDMMYEASAEARPILRAAM